MILIDTNVFVSFLNKRDKNHQRAIELVRQALSGDFGNRYTISEVFTEVSTVLFRKTKNMNIVKKAWDLMYSSDRSWGKTIIITKDHIEKAWKIFQSYTTIKKPLSLVDCLLIAVARNLEIVKIISFDDEFDGILERIY